MQSERRKFPRFDIPLDLQFSALNNAERQSSGVTVNFSREGFCFATQFPDLKLNEILELKVKIPGKDVFAPALGEIVWKHRSEAGFYAGIKLTKMDGDAKSSILGHAYDIWLEKSRH